MVWYATLRTAPFRDMQVAPRDGTVIEVRYGADQALALVDWSGQNQAWIRADDPHRKTLHQVTGWRPVGQGVTAARPHKPRPGR
jgi:hypothetical protein